VRLYLPACGDPPGAAERRRAGRRAGRAAEQTRAGGQGYHYHLAISPLDCSGCGNCVDICPSRGKALKMQSLDSQRQMAPVWDYALALTPKRIRSAKRRSKAASLKPRCWSFPAPARDAAKPLCPPDNPAVWRPDADRQRHRLLFYLGASAPSIPYTTNHRGHGPAWANSLFEDNAEFGLGMMLGGQAVRQQLADDMTAALALPVSDELRRDAPVAGEAG
jgi:pyruvate-ferredoxin/flavodoxin oxidoreductase